MEIDELNLQSLISVFLLLLIPLLYAVTMARSLILGDPTEYTLVADVLGIAHPPGYAFMTLAAKAFQTSVPVGSIPWRTHLLSAAGATLAALAALATIRAIHRATGSDKAATGWAGPAFFAAFTLATGVDVWQHAIHANPHVLTATFLIVNLFLLTRWWQTIVQPGAKEDDRWLVAFAFSAGLGVTHHPLTVFSFPAYALFILFVQPIIWRRGRTLLKLLAFALLGLSLWLYLPLRSAMLPVFGPHDLDTLQGFLSHVLARGLTESLPFFNLADQPMRALVFWTLLRLQYALPTIFLSLLGTVWLFRSRRRRPLFLLYGLAFLCNYAFVINLRAQDVMAYLLGPFMLLGLLSGAGLYGLLELVQERAGLQRRAPQLLLAALFLLGPVLQIARNLPRVSLRHYDEGRDHVEAVFDTFEDQGAGAVLLHDWEHMTPMWYVRFVEERWPDPNDVRPEFVSTQRPWLESVFATLPGGPVYLSGYRSEVVDGGFRLRPHGEFYQVVEPGNNTVPPELSPLTATAGEIDVVGMRLPQTQVTAGDYVPLTLAMRAPQTPDHVYVPSLRLGSGIRAITYTFTTDNHLLTTQWQPGEVIVERFDFALPHDLPNGEYPLVLRIKDLSTDELLPLQLPLGRLQVQDQEHPIPTAHLLANFRQRVGLVRAGAWNGFDGRLAPWQDPLQAAPGETINLILQWQSLARTEESYTVFVHLIDAANRPWITLDYTPLGGSAPTHLWIPKWLPGQRYLDPYRLTIPSDLPPGEYFLEVGLYEMTSGRRLHMSGPDGSLVGDRFILGPVTVSD